MSQIFNNVEVSHNDKRQYRYIVLPNKLRALLICDPDTEKSSCACDVKVGSMCDPQDVQGLAHFLEHMLFMGTEKYPIENEYSTYLSAHGGFSNAFTGQEDTVYYFDVQNDFFEGALDRFAAFFSCPLFTEAATFREMNAVDNENTKNLQADSWRHFQLLKSLASCDHPFSMFSTGNLETLKSIPESKGLNIREELLKFHERYYSSNVMTVAVYGPHPLDELQAWVEQKFSAIKNADLAYPSFSSEVFRPQDLSRIVSVVPVKDTKTLDLVCTVFTVCSSNLLLPVADLGMLVLMSSGLRGPPHPPALPLQAHEVHLSPPRPRKFRIHSLVSQEPGMGQLPLGRDLPRPIKLLLLSNQYWPDQRGHLAHRGYPGRGVRLCGSGAENGRAVVDRRRSAGHGRDAVSLFG